MNKEHHLQRMTAVVNTINGIQLRVDQLRDAEKLSACVIELMNLMQDLHAQIHAEQEPKEG